MAHICFICGCECYCCGDIDDCIVSHTPPRCEGCGCEDDEPEDDWGEDEWDDEDYVMQQN